MHLLENVFLGHLGIERYKSRHNVFQVFTVMFSCRRFFLVNSLPHAEFIQRSPISSPDDEYVT